MIGKVLIALLLCCAICSGQSTMTFPGGPQQPAQADTDSDTSARSCRTAEDQGYEPHQCPDPQEKIKGKTQARPRDSATDKEKLEDETRPSESTRKSGPITARSEFERFAEDGVGHPLKVYGRRLFNEVPSTFAPADHIPVPANYAIGPGDQLLIRAWGKIDLDSRVTVDRNGQISLPKVGTLDVVGLRYDQLDGYLRSAIGALYKGFELNVTLGQLRSIQVFVLGSARQPGAYTVSSLSTLVNALLASGGPSETGSMRHIQLRRGPLLDERFRYLRPPAERR